MRLHSINLYGFLCFQFGSSFMMVWFEIGPHNPTLAVYEPSKTKILRPNS